jgi:hypothetical protein
MEHAGQVDRDDAIPFSGIEVEKGGGLTNADAVEEHIQSAEFTDRRRNRGIDGRAVAHVEAERRSASAGRANSRGGRLGRRAIYGRERSLVPAPYRRALAVMIVASTSPPA